MIFDNFPLTRWARSRVVATLVLLASAVFGSTQVWQASTDFSTVQGYRNWRYMSFNPIDSSYGEMLYGTDIWGIQSWYGLDEYGNQDGTAIFPYGTHPGWNDEPARVWESPVAGTVRVTGRVAEADGSTRNPYYAPDGVLVTIWKNGDLLYSADIADSDLVGYNYDLSVHVMPGDWLIFRVNKKSNTNWDSTYFDPRIAVTSLDSSSGSSWIVSVLNEESEYVAGLNLSLFPGQNDHVREAHRLALSHELKVASNLLAGGETTAALNCLLNVIVRLQGATPPDWMLDCPEKAGLDEDIWVLINLLQSP